MDMDAYSLNLAQPILFEYAPIAKGVLELFPAVWSAAEDLTSPEVAVRRNGVHRLAEMGAARLSPLVTYLLATRLTDPDVEIRRRVICLLGDLFIPDSRGLSAPDEVRRHLSSYLVQACAPVLYALLEAAAVDASLEGRIVHLMKACPCAGAHLVEIVSERSHPLEVRKQAAHYVGVVGFVEAIPALERLVARLEARCAGQQMMPFASLPTQNEAELLPLVQKALTLLKSP